MTLIDPTTLDKWLQPHSLAWYEQLGKLQNNYKYPWMSTIMEPNGEFIFDHEVTEMVVNQKVLDVGCGDGQFMNQIAPSAREIIGFDVTDRFIQNAVQHKKSNVSFVIGNIKDGLPFEQDEFDCAYIRKGPTSAYPHLSIIIKKGGQVLGLHPGDESGKELALLFPNLFEPSPGTPILNSIQQRLSNSNFSNTKIDVINSTEYIASPTDVLKLRCFGQDPSIFETVKENNLAEITRIFEENATVNGLPITHSRYIVRAIV